MKISDFKIKKGMQADDLFSQFENAGFQASELHNASSIMKEMLGDKDCTRFLAFTANMAASGLRGIFTEMLKKKMFDAVITTGGSIDHDLIKSFSHYDLGSFQQDDVALHKKGINRLGNILVDNKNYIALEKRLQPLFAKINSKKHVFSGSELIREIALTIKDENSFLYQCQKNNIPVFSPGLIDSAIGLQLFFFKQDHKEFILDEAGDMIQLANLILTSKRTGALILGGGISKHYTIASNLLRGGLDYSVYLTTASAYDGSLSGAFPNEAKSWGKIKEKGKTAVVYGDATVLLPLLYSKVC
ncbi:deoxyhypusine synthase [Candidatus Micrarchaeota archaeon]|nr:deoxyhypusine synthase [Candidatus Micrarchaeota archaeon]